MEGGKQKKSVDLLNDDLTKLHRLPRFRGKNFADIIRALVADAIEGVAPPKPLHKLPDDEYIERVGFGGLVADIKHLDFGQAIGGSRHLFLRVPSPSFFLQYRGADALLLLRMSISMGSTLIVFCLEDDPKGGPPLIPAHEAYEVERFLARAREIPNFDDDDDGFGFHAIFRRRAELVHLPEMAVVTDEEAFIAGYAVYHDKESIVTHGFNWKRPTRPFGSEYLKIRDLFIAAFNSGDHPSDLHRGSRRLLL